MIGNTDNNDFLATLGSEGESQKILRWAEEMAIKEPGYVKRILGEIEAERKGHKPSKAKARK
jgi:hypothetical protein